MSPESSTRIQVLVLTDSKETAEFLPSLLAEEPGLQIHSAQMAFGEGLKAVARHEPHVLVLADTLENPAAAIEVLDSAAPDIPTLAILPESDLRSAQDCTLAGARATLLKPFDQDGLIEAIQQVYAREQRRRQHVVASLEPAAARQQRPRIIAVHGAKGGVGATTIACNLAAALRQLTGRRVALVDGDVLSGDAGVLFDLPPTRNISDLLVELKELDADLVEGLLAEHATGVRVLLAPDQLQRAEAIRGEDMQRVVTGLKPYFDYLVVDTPSRFSPVTLAALDEADRIVLVVTPELVALRNAARFLQLATQLGYPTEKVLLVANRANTGKDISPVVIEEQLQRPIVIALPSDGQALVETMNAGELIVAARPRNRVADGISRLGREVAGSFGWSPKKQKARAADSAPTPASARVALDPAGPPAEQRRGKDGFPLRLGKAFAILFWRSPLRLVRWVMSGLFQFLGRLLLRTGQSLTPQQPKQEFTP